MSERVRQILIDLERVQESLLAYSDDIWLSVDHNDTALLKKAIQFKIDLNDKMNRFSLAAQELSRLIQHHIGVDVDDSVAPTLLISETTEHGQVNDGPDAPFDFNEDYFYTHPYAFTLLGTRYDGVGTWRGTYSRVLRILASRNAPALSSLLNSSLVVNRRQGKKWLTRDKDGLIIPLEVRDGVYAEGCLSANAIRDRLKLLLKGFNVPESELVIYTRRVGNSSRPA